MTQEAQYTSKAYFQSLSILHATLIIGLLAFAGISIYLNTTIKPIAQDLIVPFLVIAPLLAISGILVGYYIANIRLKSIKSKSTLAEKLQDYKGVLILKYASIEGPAMFCIVAYLLTADYKLLGIGFIIFLFLFMNKPSKFRAISDLELTGSERDRLEDPEALVV